MGKATIVSGGTDGNYTIKMDYGKEVRDGRVTKVNAALAEIGPKITEALGNLNTQEIIEGGAVADVEAAINAYVAATQAVPVAHQAIDAARANVDSAQATLGNVPAGVAFDIIRGDAAASLATAKAAVTAAEAALKSAEAAIKPAIERHAKLASALMNEKARTAQKQIVLDLLNEQKKAMETEESDLSGVELEETMEAWCADFTEDGTGEVGTIEIPGENAHVLIVPGAKAHSSADGNLAARELMSPEQVFFNAAILPGWQKFKPTFRRGTITALDEDADTAGVSFDDDVSSAQGLDINRYPSLDAIPVTYMTCHARAFEVGDKCVVKFTGGNWSFPKVVGFVDHPKPCMPKYIYVNVFKPLFTVLGDVSSVRDILEGPDGGGLWQARPEPVRTLSTPIMVDGGTPSDTPIPASDYTIHCSPATLYTYESNIARYSLYIAAPPGNSGVLYDVTFDSGGIEVKKIDTPVTEETHLAVKAWKYPYYNAPDLVRDPENDTHITGGVYGDDVATYLTNGGAPGAMPVHEYVRDVLGVVPTVSFEYKGKSYAYKLQSSTGQTLKYVFNKAA